MALPIKSTPTIKGKDADAFFKRAEESLKGKHKVSDKDFERAMSIYKKVMDKQKDNN